MSSPKRDELRREELEALFGPLFTRPGKPVDAQYKSINAVLKEISQHARKWQAAIHRSDRLAAYNAAAWISLTIELRLSEHIRLPETFNKANIKAPEAQENMAVAREIQAIADAR